MNKETLTRMMDMATGHGQAVRRQIEQGDQRWTDQKKLSLGFPQEPLEPTEATIRLGVSEETQTIESA